MVAKKSDGTVAKKPSKPIEERCQTDKTGSGAVMQGDRYRVKAIGSGHVDNRHKKLWICALTVVTPPICGHMPPIRRQDCSQDSDS